MLRGQYNLRSPAVKRLMKEAQELSEPTEQFSAQPLEDNLFEWHFTIRGPEDSEFEGGIYHGRIILPPDYPMKPPSIMLLTANGRFELHTKICLSISGHHPETWQPSWSIRTALLAIIGFMPTRGGGAIGSLDYTPEERKTLARRSKTYACPTCGPTQGLVLAVTAASAATMKEAQELGSQINMVGEKQSKGAKSPQSTAASDTTTTSDLRAPVGNNPPASNQNTDNPTAPSEGDSSNQQATGGDESGANQPSQAGVAQETSQPPPEVARQPSPVNRFPERAGAVRTGPTRARENTEERTGSLPSYHRFLDSGTFYLMVLLAAIFVGLLLRRLYSTRWLGI